MNYLLCPDDQSWNHCLGPVDSMPENQRVNWMGSGRMRCRKSKLKHGILDNLEQETEHGGDTQEQSSKL